MAQAALEKIFSEFHSWDRASRDPIAMVRRDLSAADTELTSFIVAGLSYGRVEQIQKSVFELWKRLGSLGLGDQGEGLHAYLGQSFSKVALGKALKGWRHRLNTAADLVNLFEILSVHIQNGDSLCALYQKAHHDDAQLQLEKFTKALLAPASAIAKRGPKKWQGTGVAWFASSPASGSTCKRLMMWLRWMVRQDEIDLGTWNAVEVHAKNFGPPQPSRLFCPVDTHIFNWARQSDILRLRSANWKAVKEITKYFAEICPTDPLRYDFSLCHSGMAAFRDMPRAKSYEHKTKSRLMTLSQSYSRD